METKLTKTFFKKAGLDLGQPIRVLTPDIPFFDKVGKVHGYDPKRNIIDLEFPSTDGQPAQRARFYPGMDNLRFAHS